MTSLALDSAAIATTVERAIAGDEAAFARDSVLEHEPGEGLAVDEDDAARDATLAAFLPTQVDDPTWIRGAPAISGSLSKKTRRYARRLPDVTRR